MRRRLAFALLPLVLAALACGPTVGMVREFLSSAPISTAIPRIELPPVLEEELAEILDEAPEDTEEIEEAGVEEPGALELSGEVRDQMYLIEQEILGLRGLDSTGRVDRALLTPEALRQHVTEDFFADYSEEEAADDVRVLSMLGLLEPGFDLYNLYLDLYSEQIAGFYDDDLAQMFVVQGTGFGGPERITYAHEYVHALQDQTYDLDDGLGFSDDACEEDSERCAAVRALIEGDATLSEEQWLFEYATERDFNELREFYETLDSPVYDSAPNWLKEDFAYPYLAGYVFVSTFHQRGGWPEVDAIYADPPVSTEQILHPERYPTDRPVPVEVPDLAGELGTDWRELDRDVLGEWFTQLVLREQLQEEHASQAAAGWGGDTYVGLYNDETGASALVLVAVWDTPEDADEFFAALSDYGDMRFGVRTLSEAGAIEWDTDDQWASIDHSGERIIWILSPDATIGRVLQEAVGP